MGIEHTVPTPTNRTASAKFKLTVGPFPPTIRALALLPDCNACRLLSHNIEQAINDNDDEDCAILFDIARKHFMFYHVPDYVVVP